MVVAEMGGSYMAEFFQDRFYVRLSITKKSEETKKITKKAVDSTTVKKTRSKRKTESKIKEGK